MVRCFGTEHVVLITGKDMANFTRRRSLTGNDLSSSRSVCSTSKCHALIYRVILLVLFFFLLSIVLYQKLSFDPHEILGTL